MAAPASAWRWSSNWSSTWAAGSRWNRKSASARPFMFIYPWMARMTDSRNALVVDDNPTNRLVASTLLRKLGWTVSEADSGEAALAKADGEAFRLVLLDISMPGLSGEATCARLRQLRSDAPPYILGLVTNLATNLATNPATCLATDLATDLATNLATNLVTNLATNLATNPATKLAR